MSTGNGWVTAQNAGPETRAFRAWGRFTLPEIPDTLKLVIGAECAYALYLNGILLGDGPARGTHTVNYTDEYEIASRIRKGENTLAVLVYSPGVESFALAPSGGPALLLELGNGLLSGKDLQASAAEDFLYTTEEYTFPIGILEYRDLRKEPEPEWLAGKGAAEGWPKAVLSENPALLAKRIAPRGIPFLEKTILLPEEWTNQAEVVLTECPKECPVGKWLDGLKRISCSGGQAAVFPVKVSPADSGKARQLIFDFGQDRTGFPEVVLDHADGGETVFLSFAEDLAGDQIHTSYGSSPSMLFTDRYILKKGRNVLGSKMNSRGGRFLQIMILNSRKELTVAAVQFEEQRYPRPVQGTFSSDDPFLNWLWEACAETMSLCMTDVFVDCPWRERSFWLNDLVVENSTSLELFGASEIHKRAFDMAFSEQRPDGWLNGMCPAPAEKSLKFVITPANLYLFHVMDMYYRYSGDLETVRKYLPNLEKILAAVEATKDKDGMVSAPVGAWNFYDWAFEFSDICFRDHRESLFNCLYITALNRFLELSEEAEYPVDRAFYLACRDRVKAVLWKVFPVVNGRILNPCGFYEPQFQPVGAVHPPVAVQLAHALAWEAGAVPPEWKESFAEAMDDPACAVSDYYLHYYLLRELVNAGKEQTALNRIRKYWGPLEKTGEKTIFEMGIIAFGKAAAWNTGSLCHGFATAPVDFMQRVLLGIQPLKPGFREFVLNIRPCDLNHAEGTVPTPYGRISVCWSRNGRNQINVRLTVPENCCAVLPDGRCFPAGEWSFES